MIPKKKFCALRCVYVVYLLILVLAASSYSCGQVRADDEPFTLIWSSIETDDVYDVAWADVDGDGDLDLAVGGYSSQVSVYRNDGVLAGSPQMTLAWTSDESATTHSLAWGDVDGDGDLDLAVGNTGPNRIYRNDDGQLPRRIDPRQDAVRIGLVASGPARRHAVATQHPLQRRPVVSLCRYVDRVAIVPIIPPT